MFSTREPDELAVDSLVRAHHLLVGMAAAVRCATDDRELFTTFQQLLRETGYPDVWISDVATSDVTGPIGRKASVTLPLISHNRPLGVLHLCASPTRSLDAAELALLNEVAAQLAFGITTCHLRAECQSTSAQALAQEEALRDSEERYRRIFQDGPLGMLTTGENFHFHSANAAICHMLGYSEAELGALTFLDITHPEHHASDAEQVQRLRRGEISVYRTEKRYLRKTGDVLWGALTISTVRDRDGAFLYYLAMVDDITARKQAENALLESERLYRTLVYALPDGVVQTDIRGYATFVSPKIKDLYGVGMPEGVGSHCLQWVAPESMEKAQTKIRELFESGVPKSGEYLLLRKDGSRFHGEISGAMLTDEQGMPAGMVTIHRDITDRKRAEEALRASEERLAVTLRSIGDGVIAVDTDGRVTLLNPVAEQLTGWRQRDAAGRLLAEVFPIVSEETRATRQNPAEIVLRTGETFEQSNHTLLIARDGVERIISEGASPIRDQEDRIIGAVLVFRDVTADVHTQRELQRMARMDSLGVMAGGIAHDFNNLLTAIAGNVGLAQLSLTLQNPAELQRHLAEAEQAAIRARDLTMQLLTFAKGGAPQRKTVTLAPLLQETVSFALTGSQCRAQVTCASDLWPIHADAGQLTQVVQNLLLNADQATPGGGLIEVIADNVRLTDGGRPPLPAGPYVRIIVRDYGIGIGPEIKEKIFDPFFTTKRVGSGLGLASVYSIVRSHDGLVAVDSQPGQGSAFSVFLPAQPRLAPQQVARMTAETSQVPWRILVLDDELAIREILQDVLEGAGHTVVTVSEGTQAIACWIEALQTGEHFDLGIFDLTVPGGKGGKDVVTELRQRDPHLRAIASSGYANDPIMAHYRHYGFTERLAKPYRINDILELIAQLQKNSQQLIE
ncbi:MAG TPA: PAS domain S-box protein [Armatimonadota bacterium]|jgi:PAS domain S-box-containing protein